VWEWKRRLDRVDGLRIGIVWQGNPEHKGDRIRSIPLKCFEALAELIEGDVAVRSMFPPPSSAKQ
jgi:hypothetical protein